MSNSLATVHPELIVEWSDRNLPLTPDSITFGSNKKVCQIKKECMVALQEMRYLADERNLKVSTIDSIHTVLHQILQIAVDDD